jgi:YD repeat-containing protein
MIWCDDNKSPSDEPYELPNDWDVHAISTIKLLLFTLQRRRLWTKAQIGSRALVGIGLSIICLVAIAANADAQSGSVVEENGAQPNRSYLALLPFESIDTSSGNVMLSFTDLELPGNGGRALRFDRFFSNGLGTILSDRRWRFSISGLPMRVQGLSTADNGVPGDSILLNQTYCPALQMADGTVQKMVFMESPSISIRWCMTPAFWKFDRLLRRLYTPDGNFADYDASGRLVAISDSFLNQTTLTYGSSSLVVRQSLGQGQERVVELVMDDVAFMPLAMTFAGRTWQYQYQSGALTQVTPPSPVGPGWAYAYDERGKIQQVTTPHGGRVTYEYDWMDFPRADGGEASRVHTLKTRRTHGGQEDGAWEFSYPTNITNSAGTIVKLPSGSIVTHLYGKWGVDGSPALSSRWVLLSRTIQTGPTAEPLETETLSYTQLKAARPDKDWYTNELSRRVIERSGQTFTTDYIYDTTSGADATLSNYHRPIRVEESGHSGATTRKRYLTYRHFDGLSLYMLGLPSSESIEANNQTFASGWTYNEETGFRESETRYGITTTFESDPFGNVASVTKANGKWTSYAYSWGQVAQIATPHVVTSRQINPDGTVASETVAGRVTTFKYDQIGRIWKVQPPGENPTPNVTETTYDNTIGQLVTVTRGASVTTTTLDGFGRPIRTENTVGIRTHTEYDAEGRVRKQSFPYHNGIGEGDIGTTFTYDALGRVVREDNPGNPGTFRSRVYTAGKVTIYDEENRATEQTYQAFGDPDDARLVGIKDANLQQWTYQYNALGSLTRVTAPDGTQRDWVYDARNLLTSETHPESGTVTYGYDSAGVLVSKTDAKGTGFVYGHDENDRLTSITANGETTSFTYKAGSDERDTVSGGQVSTQFDYTPAGHLFSRNDAIDGQNFLTRFTYDANDNLKTITYTSGRRVAYDYDTENRLTAVYNGYNPSISYAGSFDYHPSGALLSLYVGGKLTTYAYDPWRYWLTSHNVGTDLQLGYSNYDGVGNVRTISDSRPNMTQTFTYDALDRLWTATGAYGTSTFTYDVHGNRQAANYTYWPNTFRLRSIDGNATQMTYDNNGNLLTGPQAVFTYTPNNMMRTSVVGSASTQFTYDGDDWRVKKEVSGAAITYFVRGPNGQLLTEWRSGSPADVKDYVYAGGRLVGVVRVER